MTRAFYTMFNIDQIIQDLDPDSLEDFSLAIPNSVDFVEQQIMTLRGGRGDESNVDTIVTTLEDIKMQCRLVFLDPLLAYVDVVEQVVNQIYRHNNHQCEELTELVLLMFDEIRAACDEVYLRHSLDVQLLNEFGTSMRELLSVDKNNVDEFVKDMLSSFAYRVHPDMVFKASEAEVFNHAQPVNRHEQLLVFEDIAFHIDNRHPFTVGRTNIVLNTSLAINQYLSSNDAVDTNQLTAAVYLHDMAMVYIPDHVLFKTEKFSSDDIMLLEQHPGQSAKILQLVPHWQSAAQMVLQHHERYDGKGYPNHLLGPNICTGAKIIAVADAFYSLTHQRSDRKFKKSTLRALMEINKNNGTQFDPACVEALNLAMQESR